VTKLSKLLQDLVQIPSPNPPGDTQDIAAFIAEWLRAANCTVAKPVPEVKPEAVNVVAMIGQGDPVIMLHAHIDTVPIAENEAQKWNYDPYAATVENGRLYGKGSVDDKAPLAAMMIAMKHVADHIDHINGTLVLVAAAEEEVGGRLGTRWMANNGHLPECDFIIVGEQTHNRVATAHKGLVRAIVRTVGKSVHATNPNRGINAINAMARVILALENYHNELANKQHPIVGVPTCNVGVIQGGSTTNAVPDFCEIKLDRRMVPGESPDVVQTELVQVVGSVNISPAEASIDDFLVSNWFESTIDSSLAQTFLACVETESGDHPGPVGYLPGSDAKHLTELALGDMVIFGPGSYEVAHAFDEYVALDELEITTKILTNFFDQTLIESG
jgi:acetylornithine deacetylase/succinyl-diaminopimelate desuccinylase family protein